MSMPENWYWSCSCGEGGMSDMPLSGELEIWEASKAHIAGRPDHRCQLVYELWLGFVGHDSKIPARVYLAGSHNPIIPNP